MDIERSFNQIIENTINSKYTTIAFPFIIQNMAFLIVFQAVSQIKLNGELFNVV